MMRVHQLLAANVLLAAIYFLAGRFGLSLAFLHQSASAVWPPTGLAITAVLLFGWRMLPGVFIGAFLVNIMINDSMAVVAGIALGNTLESFVGAWMARKAARGLEAFHQANTALKFALFAALPATMLSATIGVTSLCAGGYADWEKFSSVWITWWLGDFVSAIIVCPLLITWLSPSLGSVSRQRLPELALLSMTLICAGSLVFGKWSMVGTERYPFDFLLIPGLLWAAYRFEQRGAASATFLISAIAIYGTLQGFGPFAVQDRNTALILLQGFMGTITLTSLVLGALVSERRISDEKRQQAETELRLYAKELESRVLDRTAELSASVKSLESFCYSIAHDLRAPLRGIHGLCAALGEDYEKLLDATGRDYLVRITAAVERMDQLIQDLLEYGRVSKEEGSGAPTDIAAVLNALRAELNGEIQQSNAVLEISGPLPVLAINKTVLSQVFRNLLTNALKFVPNGTAPRIRIWSEFSNGTVRIAIEDNGIGIDPEHHERIFRLFERLYPESSYPGTGVGLAIVKKGVERAGGGVRVESKLGQGSCFWLEFPANRAASE